MAEKDQNRNQHRAWMLTVPADRYGEADLRRLLGTDRYSFIGQLERGKEKTPLNPDGYLHWQLYLQSATSSAVAFATLHKLIPEAHLEPAKGNSIECVAYCTKVDTAQGVSISHGTIRESGISSASAAARARAELHDRVWDGMETEAQIISALDPAPYLLHYLEKQVAARDELSDRNDREVMVHYLWGETGSGKSYFLHHRTPQLPTYFVHDYSHPWDAYQGEPCLVLEEYHSQFAASQLLTLLDVYALRLPARYRDRWARWTEVWVVSNARLEGQYRHLQDAEPATWNAILRRFMTVEQMCPDHTRHATPVAPLPVPHFASVFDEAAAASSSVDPVELTVDDVQPPAPATVSASAVPWSLSSAVAPDRPMTDAEFDAVTEFEAQHPALDDLRSARPLPGLGIDPR